MKHRSTAAALAAASLLYSVAMAETPAPKGDTARGNYSLGYWLGDEIMRDALELDEASLLRGLRDAMQQRPPAVSADEMQERRAELQKQIVARQREQQRRELQQRLEQGREYLARNKSRDGVQTLPSGLQYRVLRAGDGKQPTAADTVEVNYRGTLVDGSEFDSSYKRGKPARFPVKGVIPGWTEALQLMREGARWELAIPAELAYGSRGRLANQTLLFEVELLAVNPP